jgi:hypothetical protein
LKGAIGFWVYPTQANDNVLVDLFIDDNNNLAINEANNGSNARISVIWDSNGNPTYINGTYGDLKINAWNWVKVTWDTDKSQLAIFTNGIQSGSTGSITSGLNGDFTSIYIGNAPACGYTSNFYLDSVYITNSPDTPEIPTAFGRPIRMPQMRVAPPLPLLQEEGTTLQGFGKDYRAGFTLDGSSVIVQYFKDVATPYTFEIGEGAGAGHIKRMQGGVRVNGGVRL